MAHFSLGNARDQRKLDEAIAEYQTAIRVNHTYAEAHCNLGLTLLDIGELDEAIVEYRAASA